MKPIIDVKNLNVTYSLGRSNEYRALKDINLDIKPGEYVIFFGPSGCGKSTLLYSIAGLEKRARGDIIIDGKNVSKLSVREEEELHQTKTGMIFQSFFLIDSLNILKNVILPQMAINKGHRERTKKAMDLLTRFGVKEQAKKLPNEISGGQQQRTAICRAVVNDPDILFADEPVGNLDSKATDEVMRLLGDLNKNEKKTIVLVTHNPAHLSYAHRVFYMKDGEIIKVKVNRDVDEAGKEKEKTLTISKDLEMLARSFESIKNAGHLLIPFKAKQIVSEVLTGMTTEEISDIEEKVKTMLITSIYDDNSIFFNYLDADKNDGGLGMDKRTAEKLSEKIKEIVKEVKFLSKQEEEAAKQGMSGFGQEIIQLRHYLFDYLKLELDDIESLVIVDRAIKDRLENKIDKIKFREIIDLPIKDGGAGLDRRSARKMSKVLELLILGKLK